MQFFFTCTLHKAGKNEPMLHCENKQKPAGEKGERKKE